MDERMKAEIDELCRRLTQSLDCLEAMKAGDRKAAIRLSAMWSREQYHGATIRVNVEGFIAAVLDLED